MQKRDNWFVDYQTIPGVTEGMRKLEDRTSKFVTSDFKDATVLDLGCNVGQMCFWAAWNGAENVTGVEYDSNAFKLAMKYRDHLLQEDGTHGLKENNVAFKLDDLDLPTAWHNLPMADVVMLLSVIDTKELKNRLGILSRSCMKTRKVFYLEGHLRQPSTKYMQMILDNTDFPSIVGLGQQAGRDLYRCTREILDADVFRRKLKEAMTKHQRVGVIGNQMAGKSTLRADVADAEGWEILDDCNYMPTLCKQDKNLLLFDYRAALYLDDLDVVFNVLQPGEKSEKKRDCLDYLRSAQLKPITRLKEFHTVLTHGGVAPSHSLDTPAGDD